VTAERPKGRDTLEWHRLRWPGLWAPAAVLAGAFVAAGLFAIVVFDSTGYVSTVLTTAAFQALLALGSFWLIARANGTSWGELGAAAVRLERSDLLYVAGYVVFVIPTALAIAFLLAHLGVVDETHAAELVSPGVMVLSFTVAPLGEELWGRGILFGSLARFGPWVAVPITAAVSSSIHLSVPQVVATFPGMLALGFIRHRTGRLAPCVVTHALNNAFVAVLVTLALGAGVG